jgi:hypothetical protein
VLQNGRADSRWKLRLECVGDGTAKPNRRDREKRVEIGCFGDQTNDLKPEENTAFRGRFIQQQNTAEAMEYNNK